MSDIQPKFPESILQIRLFKGRNDWYFCFLKLEKIAQVCSILADRRSDGRENGLNNLQICAAALPKKMFHFASGEVSLDSVLADIFSVLVEIRLGVVRDLVTIENGSVLMAECTLVAEKLTSGARISLSLSSDDFSVEALSVGVSESRTSETFSERYFKETSLNQKDNIKDSFKNSRPTLGGGLSGRSSLILDFVGKNSPVSIKDISASVRGCSEKTIQRELNVLIGRGLVQRSGERRWSQYSRVS